MRVSLRTQGWVRLYDPSSGLKTYELQMQHVQVIKQYQRRGWKLVPGTLTLTANPQQAVKAGKQKCLVFITSEVVDRAEPDFAEILVG